MADADISDSNDSDYRFGASSSDNFRDDSPLSFSSFRKRSLSHERSIDISQLERDAEILKRKANKRLGNKVFDGRSETFLEKFINWHRKRKIEKIRGMLNSLFPKLKHTEEEVKDWLKAVSEKKESTLQSCSLLLHDVDHQIHLYTSHLEFLDEVINDVKQLDYDIVKEISELKVALYFNQELLKKHRPMITPSASEESVKSALSNEAAANDHVKLQNGEHDEGLILNDRVRKNSFPKKHSEPVAEPAVWHGVKTNQMNEGRMHIATSPFTRSIAAMNMTNTMDSDKLRDDHTASKNTTTPNTSSKSSDKTKSSKSSSSKPSSKHSSKNTSPVRSSSACDEVLVNVGEPSSPEVVWDGAESKRKSLQKGSISLKTLSINSNIDSDMTMPCGKGVGNHQITPTRQRAHTTSSMTPSNSDDNSPFFTLFKRNSTTSPLTTTPTEGHSTSFFKTISPKNANTFSRNRTNSNSSAVSSSSESNRDSITNTNSSSNKSLYTSDSINSDKSHSNSNKSNFYSKYSNNHKINLTNLLAKINSNEVNNANEGDCDQSELLTRIQKCLSLKEILKTILKIISETQDNEYITLSNMKKLKYEIHTILQSEHITPTVSNGGMVTGESSRRSTVTTVETPSSPVSMVRNSSASISSIVHDNSHHTSSDTSNGHGDSNGGVSGNRHSWGHSNSSHNAHAIPTMSTIPEDTDTTNTATSNGNVHALDHPRHSNNHSNANSNGHSPLNTTDVSLSDGSHSPHNHKTRSGHKPPLHPPHGHHHSTPVKVSLTYLNKTPGSNDSLSLASNSSPVTDSHFPEVAGEFMEDLKLLIVEEKEAKEKLHKLHSLLHTASTINDQVNHVLPLTNGATAAATAGPPVIVMANHK